MICTFFSFIAPCYELVDRVQLEQSIRSGGSQNNGDFLSCKSRCEGLNRKIPSYTMMEQLELGFIVNEICNGTTCTFPIDVYYDKGCAFSKIKILCVIFN